MTDQQQQAPTQQGGSVRNAVAQRQQSRARSLWRSRYQTDLAQVLPAHIESKAFVGSAIGALRKNPALMEAAENAPGAFMDALMECASLGHVPGGKEFYLTVRRSKHHDGKPIIAGLEGYRGVIERMYRSGAVASVIVREVCEGDTFRFVEGVDEVPQHTRRLVRRRPEQPGADHRRLRLRPSHDGRDVARGRALAGRLREGEAGLRRRAQGRRSVEGPLPGDVLEDAGAPARTVGAHVRRVPAGSLAGNG